jgi:hypothetical protein
MVHCLSSVSLSDVEELSVACLTLEKMRGQRRRSGVCWRIGRRDVHLVDPAPNVNLTWSSRLDRQCEGL